MSSGSKGLKSLVQIGNYTIDRHTLGCGAFGRVEQGSHKILKSKVALKLIDLRKINDEYIKKNLDREPSLMINLQHPNIVGLIEVCKSNDIYCMVLEYLPGVTLLEELRRKRKLPENNAKDIASQMIGAIAYMHGKRIIHRDLKLENVMINELKKITLIDLGLSTLWKPCQVMNTFCGSPEYAAPELFRRNRFYGPGCDIWSFGVILYVLVIGRFPFMEQPERSTGLSLANIVLRGLVLPRHNTELATVSILLRSLIMRCLEVNNVKRISAVGIINDPWLILGSSRFGRPNTFGKRKNFYVKEQIISEMKRRLSIEKSTEFVLQHLKKSPFGTTAGAYKLVELQLEENENTLKDVFKRKISQNQHANVPLRTLPIKRPAIRNQFQNYQAQTVSILKKKSTIGHGFNRSIQTKKSVRFALQPKDKSRNDEDTPPPDKIMPYSRKPLIPKNMNVLNNSNMSNQGNPHVGNKVPTPKNNSRIDEDTPQPDKIMPYSRRTLIPRNMNVLNNSKMPYQKNPYVNNNEPTPKKTLLSRTFSSSNPGRHRILNSLEINKENLNPYISKENVLPNPSRTFSSSSSRQSRVLNSLEFNVTNNSQSKKRKIEKNCSMEMTMLSLKRIFM